MSNRGSGANSKISSYFKYNVLLNDPELDNNSKAVFFIMNSVFLGFFVSLLLGAVVALYAYIFARPSFSQFLNDYLLGYNCFVTGGLCFGLAFQVYQTQKFIPDLLSEVFNEKKLKRNEIFQRHKQAYFSRVASLRIVSIHVILSFTIFYFAQFPYEDEVLRTFMMLFGSALFGCGVYVGRKIFYVAQMLLSIENIKFKKDIFSDDALDGISAYVNVITTFTVIATWLLIDSYFKGTFSYHSVLGESVKAFLFYPAITAMPVLIVFNYYPRRFLRKLYSKSIDIKINTLREELNSKEDITEFEKIQYLSDVDKISKDELKYKLRLALNDLPLIITIVIMLLGLIVG